MVFLAVVLVALLLVVLVAPSFNAEQFIYVP